MSANKTRIDREREWLSTAYNIARRSRLKHAGELLPGDHPNKIEADKRHMKFYTANHKLIEIGELCAKFNYHVQNNKSLSTWKWHVKE